MKLCRNIVRTFFLLAASNNVRFATADDVGPGPNGEESVDYQDLLDTPTTLWTAQIFPDAALGAPNVEAGNGAFMAPDGHHFMVTTVGATVYAYNAYSGEKKWHYQPDAVGSSIARSHSAVIFSPTEEFMVYAVVDNENSLDPSSRIIGLDMEGEAIWISDDLNGVASGNPQISSDGMYVFITHNADDKSNGYFTILDATTGSIFYSGSSGEAGDEPTNAYGPIGIFHTPEQGNYDPIETGATVSEGDFNTNDMLMWAQTPKPTDAAIQNGFVFGFQFPRDFIGNATDVSYFQMGSFERDFQTLTPPVMTNSGLSGYWGVTRSGFRAWSPKRYSRARSATIGFTRNEDFPGQAIWAVPTLSNDGPEPTIFGGSAAKQFVRMNYDFSEQMTVPTVGYVKTAALVDGDERAVYYVESDTGTLHQADFDNLSDNWNFPMNFSVDGEMAMTPKSDVVIVADTRGVITALQVADIPVTNSPSGMPTDEPSTKLSMVPTTSHAPVDPSATDEPTTATPTTTAPVAVPVAAPVATPIGGEEPEPAPVAGSTVEEPEPSPAEPVGSSATTSFVSYVVAAFAIVVSTLTMM